MDFHQNTQSDMQPENINEQMPPQKQMVSESTADNTMDSNSNNDGDYAYNNCNQNNNGGSSSYNGSSSNPYNNYNQNNNGINNSYNNYSQNDNGNNNSYNNYSQNNNGSNNSYNNYSQSNNGSNTYNNYNPNSNGSNTYNNYNPNSNGDNTYNNYSQNSNTYNNYNPNNSSNGYNNGYPYYGRSAYQMPYSEPGSSFASASMVLGIISIITSFTFTVYPAFVLGSIAITLALLSKGRRPKLLSKAHVGVVCGIAGLVINTAIVTCSMVLLFTNPDVKAEVNKTFEKQYGMSFDEMWEEIMENSGY